MADVFIQQFICSATWIMDQRKQPANTAIVNTSITKILGINQRFEIKPSVSDLFNQHKNITYFATANNIEKNSSNSIGRFSILSVKYNLKVFKSAEK